MIENKESQRSDSGIFGDGEGSSDDEEEDDIDLEAIKAKVQSQLKGNLFFEFFDNIFDMFMIQENCLLHREPQRTL